MPPSGRRQLVQMLAIALVATGVLLAIAFIYHWFPKQADTQAKEIDRLYYVLLAVSVPIFVLVMTVAIFSVVKFRARPGDMRDGAPIHGHTGLEVVWVTIPFLLVSGLAGYGAFVLADIEKKKPNQLPVHVIARQFTWRFEYPQPGGRKAMSNTLVLPQGRPVEFKINTLDVIHSFWVPAFRIKRDAVPGTTQTVRVTPTRLGNYDVVCAELCGVGHSTMRVRVNVLPRTRFNSWLASRLKGPAVAAAPKAASPAQLAALGKQVFTGPGGCNACHTLADAGATGKVGPDLDHVVADAKKFGKGQTPDAYIKQSILDPNAIVRKGFPANTMPNDFGQRLSPQQINALVRYLSKVGGK